MIKTTFWQQSLESMLTNLSLGEINVTFPNREIKNQERIVNTKACLKPILIFSFLNEKNKTKPIKKVIILE